MSTIRISAICGAILCLLVVAIGVHMFEAVLLAKQKQSVFDLANRYQFYHGLALMVISALLVLRIVKVLRRSVYYLPC